MWRYNSPEELYHYGVLGMKWGKRKAAIYRNKAKQERNKKSIDKANKYDAKAAKIERSINIKNSRISADSRRVSKIRKKPINEMSNQDLRDVNKRLELESKYKELKGKSNIGKKVVQTFIATGTTIVAIETASRTYKKLGDSVVKKIGKKTINR